MIKIICPACNKFIGKFHKTSNGFHRDCFKHWEKGYETAMRFADNELQIKKLPSIMELYNERMKYEVH